ncbi:MAG: MerR family transcriptional regulator [Pseudomonadota bacterium]
MEKLLPSIPVKRYFTIGEVSDLCGVKPYVLRYWEQEFSQLKPMKRRGNRRYYQHHEVLLIRRIRELLYDEGFTISGARNRLADAGSGRDASALSSGLEVHEIDDANLVAAVTDMVAAVSSSAFSSASAMAALNDGSATHAVMLPEPVALHAAWPPGPLTPPQLREELISIRALLMV